MESPHGGCNNPWTRHAVTGAHGVAATHTIAATRETTADWRVAVAQGAAGTHHIAGACRTDARHPRPPPRIELRKSGASPPGRFKECQADLPEAGESSITLGPNRFGAELGWFRAKLAGPGPTSTSPGRSRPMLRRVTPMGAKIAGIWRRWGRTRPCLGDGGQLEGNSGELTEAGRRVGDPSRAEGDALVIWAANFR